MVFGSVSVSNFSKDPASGLSDFLNSAFDCTSHADPTLVLSEVRK